LIEHPYQETGIEDLEHLWWVMYEEGGLLRGHIWIPRKGKQKERCIGWIFERDSQDPEHPYIREMWVKVFKGPPEVVLKFDYQDVPQKELDQPLPPELEGR